MTNSENSSGGPPQGGGRRRRRRRPAGAQGNRPAGQGNRSGRSGRGRGPGRRSQGSRRPAKAVVENVPEGTPSVEVNGVLDLLEQGHGCLRSGANDFRAEPGDPVVPRSLIRDLNLESGAELRGMGIASERQGTAPCLAEIQSINGHDAKVWKERKPFKDLIAEDPVERIRLERDPEDLSTRVVDLVSPIGKGQRCLIVAPPKAGKTVLLQKIAGSITENHPEIHLIVLLVDERPEEVTDMRRSVKGEVIASSADELARNHLHVAEIALDRAKSLVETGGDVVVLLDSITRLSRAYNTEQRGSGRVLSGGIDARTMEKPRRFFGAARNAVDGGSLTVIGTALVDTGSRMDEVIFQEFKGTGNTEIIMDRGLFDRRIFPAIDISKSGTRKEEKLFSSFEYEKVTLLRRALAQLRSGEAMQLLTQKLGAYKTNEEFLKDLNR